MREQHLEGFLFQFNLDWEKLRVWVAGWVRVGGVGGFSLGGWAI